MQKLLDSLQAFDQCRIAVVGDLMLDEYLWGHIERISPEAPVPILNVKRRAFTLGGAGNVAENLRKLGVQVKAFGVVGCDETGEKVRALLAEDGVDVHGVIQDPHRQSTRKVRMMSLEHGQQVFRMDHETTSEVTGDIEGRLIDMVRSALKSVQVVLFSDYMKGVLTERVLNSIFTAARKQGIPSVVAPKDSKADRYRGATVLFPNARELAQLAESKMDGDGWLKDSAAWLMDKLDLKLLVVTRGGKGMSFFERHGGAFLHTDIATTARSVYDVTGAGDTAIAVFSACLATGATCETAVRLANLAAGVKVGKRGTACVSKEELAELLDQEFLNNAWSPIDSCEPELVDIEENRSQSISASTRHLPKV
jgi:D-beta-D-heptose 7-phosphate kinase/D-beta-D-heptose 1-phosphate adenosyltransferase